MLWRMLRDAGVPNVLCVVFAFFGFLATMTAIGTLSDYWTGHIGGYSKWGEKGPDMALNTAATILLLGISTTGISLIVESQLLRRSARTAS